MPSKVAEHQYMVIVAQRTLSGMKQREIAEELGVSQQYVAEMMGKIRQRWQTATLEFWHMHVANELNKLQDIEDAAWEAFEQSKKAVQCIDQDGNSEWVDVPGDPRYLDIVHRTMDSRAKRLRLYDFDPRTQRDAGTEAARTILQIEPGAYADTASAIANAINGEDSAPRATSASNKRRATRGSEATNEHQYPAPSSLPRALRAV